ncbi:MAG: DUF4386 domain-containing protein [Sphingobacteriales bacterium]|nr:DUF4386 domain-containing protein [Sphingobacteriales bacterium]
MAIFPLKMTLRKAAIFAGFGYILMFGTAIAEFTVMGKLVDMNNGDLTVKNISTNLPLFRHGIMFYTINFIGDIMAAWGIYILLKPVSNFFSLVAASLRLVFTILSLVVLMNLLTVLQLLQPHDYLNAFSTGQLQAQTMIALRAFIEGWLYCYIFFGLYLILIGYLVFISKYIPKLIGVCLIIAGLGWLTDSIQPYLFPSMKMSIGMTTGILELVFMFWLFIKGSKLKERD